MDKQSLETILNEWQISSTAERWSLKSMFLQDHPQGYTAEQFQNFLEVKVGRHKKSRRTKP